MTTIRLFRLELYRLFRERLALLMFTLTAVSPGIGLSFFRAISSTSEEGYVTTMNGYYIANPALAGGTIGAVLFAILTILQFNYGTRYRISTITDAIVSPLTQALVRLGALLASAGAVQLVTTLLWLPYSMLKVGAVFDIQTYLLSYWVFMFPALVLAALFSAAAYQFMGRADLSFTAFVVFCFLSVNVWNKKWQLCWLNPVLFAVSDDFSNFRMFRTVGYMRMTWLLALSGLWVMSWVCVRQYGKGILGSFLCNIRRVYRPATAIILLAAAGAAYVAQPFYDNSDPDLSQRVFDGEYNPSLTCSEQYADVRPDAGKGSLYGKAVYQLQNTSGEPQTLELVIDPGYKLSDVKVNGRDTAWSVTDIQKTNGLVVKVELPAEPELELSVSYGGFPREWNLASSYGSGDPEISGVYMCLENQRLAPCIRNAAYRDDVLPATIDLTLPEQMTPVLFGRGDAELLQENKDHTRTWRILNTGYYAIIYAGDYVRQEIKAEDLTINLYYGRKHETIMKEAKVGETVRSVVNYCTAHYGPLQFYADGTFKLLQTRATGGGYAADGASTLNELDFTAQNLTNKNKGSGSGEVMIHELVHQWWGLGNMFDTVDSKDPWSSEGLTVYTTYRIVKELYGEEYAKEHYVDQWQQAVDDYYKNFYVRNPQYLSALPEQYQYNIENSVGSMRRYSEMPLKILKAEQLVGGEAAMDKILSGLFNREIDWSYPYLTYQDFLDACGLTKEELSLD
ncbi:MAG TPA: M1 family metallopeptidase [Clostridiales bacterium]|nr:M1 family metallopeptidase [Clostridiales bacterium]